MSVNISMVSRVFIYDMFGNMSEIMCLICLWYASHTRSRRETAPQSHQIEQPKRLINLTEGQSRQLPVCEAKFIS